MNLGKRQVGFLLFLLHSFFCFSQSPVALSGRILSDDLKPLHNAGIYISQFSSGTFTDSLGRFQMRLKPGLSEVSFSYIGYNPQTVQLFLSHDTTIQITLQTNLQLGEVTIVDRKQMLNALHEINGTITLRKENFNSLPAFLGENDPFHAVQMQPGVQSGNEGARGIFIRGGSPDQNLILLDGASVYNPSHIYGFISVFNADAVDRLNVYKDYYPSRYGGRLCSVLDVHISDGDTAKLRGSVSLGFITSRIHLTGPFDKKHKTTFTLSLRGCYIGLYTAPISRRLYKSGGYEGAIYYYFGDANVKLVHRFTPKTKLELSFFTNNDFYDFRRDYSSTAYTDFKEDETIRHGIRRANYVSSLALTHHFDEQWHMNQLVSFTRYQMVYTDRVHYNQTYLRNNSNSYYSLFDSKNQSYINDLSWREDAVFATEQQTFDFGAGVTGSFFQTGKGSYTFNNIFNGNLFYDLKGTIFKTLDAFLFAEDEYHPHEHWLISGGFHTRIYNVQRKTFGSLLPRVSVLYNPVAKFYLRGSASGLTQNVHLLATASSNILNDYWVPATAIAKPETGWNLSAGMTQKLPLFFEWSIDGFYRPVNNLIEYKDGNEQASIYEPWENQITTNGKGRSYGAEFYVARSKGKITGSVAYTLAWSERKFTDLNNGQYYPYKYDRRHNLAAQITFLVGKHFELGAAFVYGSGNRFSLPLQSYHTFGVVNAYDIQLSEGYRNPSTNDLITIYSGKNNARLPAYQHLDVSFTYRKQHKNLEHAFNFSVYNVYNNFNIFSVYSDYRTNADGSRSLVFKKLSLFPVLPSLSYTIKFMT